MAIIALNKISKELRKGNSEGVLFRAEKICRGGGRGHLMWELRIRLGWGRKEAKSSENVLQKWGSEAHPSLRKGEFRNLVFLLALGLHLFVSRADGHLGGRISGLSTGGWAEIPTTLLAWAFDWNIQHVSYSWTTLWRSSVGLLWLHICC